MPPLEVNEISLGNVAFAAHTADNSIVVFVGVDTMFTSLGMMLSHSPAICGIVRNMALLMSRVHKTDEQFLLKLARHGDVEPLETPFAALVDGPNNAAFSAELSLYEVAHMSFCVIDSYKHIAQQLPSANVSIEQAFKFWNQIWVKLPNEVKMSVLHEGNDTVN